MMDKLTKTEHAKLIKLIPKIIGRSINTFKQLFKYTSQAPKKRFLTT